MSALEKLHEYGLQAKAEGDRLQVSPADRLNDELRQFIREHKPEILRELSGPDQLQQEALRLLESDPALKYGMATDTDSNPDSVLVALAIRDVGTVNLFIPADKYDPWLLMEILEQQREAN